MAFPVVALMLAAGAGQCPSMVVVSKPGKPGELSFELVASPALTKPSFTWTISVGRIKSGQGKPVIIVAGEPDDFITATVEVGGLPPECMNTASASDEIIEG